MPRRPKWKSMLETSRDEATLAVEVFNNPSTPRSLEAFIVHMHLAWLHLLHAIFERDGAPDYRCWKDGNPKRLIKIDGEVKLWDLSTSTKAHFGEQDIRTKSIKFFIGLRNKIEHRHFQADENISVLVLGRAQALLLNYEKELVEQFGAKWTLSGVLRTPLFIGSFTEDGERTLLDLRSRAPSHIRDFIARFDAGLDDDDLKSPKFDLQLRVMLKAVQRGGDGLAIEFMRYDNLNDEEKAALAILERKGAVIIQERHQQVANLERLRPGSVVERVAVVIPFEFNLHHHTQAWKRLEVRPVKGADEPRTTNQRYCFYDEPHNDYVFTEAWIENLTQRCSTEDGFREVTGREPVLKSE